MGLWHCGTSWVRHIRSLYQWAHLARPTPEPFVLVTEAMQHQEKAVGIMAAPEAGLLPRALDYSTLGAKLCQNLLGPPLFG